MILSKKRITKVLIRLRGCAGWSAHVLFANPEDRFTCDEAQSSADPEGGSGGPDPPEKSQKYRGF